MAGLKRIVTLRHSDEYERVWHVSWDPNGVFLASCGEDKIIKLWAIVCQDNIFKASCISTLEDAQSRTIRCCEWSPCGNFIASASFDGTVVVWETQNSSKRNWDQVAQIEGHESEVKCVAWSSKGNYLATCGRDKKVWIWEKLGDCEFECVSVLDSHTQDVKFVSFHPKLLSLISTSYDDSIKIWSEDNDDWFCTETLLGHTSTVWGASFNHDGNRLVTCSDDRSICLWESDNSNGYGGVYRTIGKLSDLHDFPIYSCHWSAENGHVATGGGDNAISICSVGPSSEDIPFGVECVVQNAHESDVNCVRWNPKSTTSNILASSGDDGCIHLWQLEM